jgi:hypothetical protein
LPTAVGAVRVVENAPLPLGTVVDPVGPDTVIVALLAKYEP